MPTGPPRRSGTPSDQRPKWRDPRTWVLWIAVLGALAFLIVPPLVDGERTANYNYTTFVNKVEQDAVQRITVRPEGQVQGELKNGTPFTTQIPTALDTDTLKDTLTKHGVAIDAVGPSAQWTSWLIALLPIVVLVAVFLWISRRMRQGAGGGLGALSQVGRSRAKIYDTSRPRTTFEDVAGYKGVKEEINEVVDYLRRPNRYRKAGAVGPKGVLMLGPPGSGKTLIARAVAGEADVPFLSVDASSFVEMFVGVGASRVRDLFEEARKRAPAIIFVDELDAVGQKRSAGGGGAAGGGNSEREQTLHQLLAEIDGFEPASGVVVMAATNRPEVLDEALLRPGRFDRHVTVPLPNKEERRAILAVHAKGKTLSNDVDFDTVARMTPGFSGADLSHLVNEAAIRAVRDDRASITHGDFIEARDRVLLGRRDETHALLPDEQRSVAVHEGGHALVATLVGHPDPVERVTILPAGQALGTTEQLPEDERHLRFEGYLEDTLAVRLGGRAAEMQVFGQVSTGSANDLANATKIATKMVREYGMSAALGPVGFSDGGPGFLGNGQDGQLLQRPYAEFTQRRIDEEVAIILRKAHGRADSLLRRHRPALDALADRLVEEETVGGDVVVAIARDTPPADEPVERTESAADAHHAPRDV